MPYHSFSVTKTARYFTAGPAIAEAKSALIALHGYGQLPEFFMRRLQPLADAGWAIVAPEGLHRYYNGPSGNPWRMPDGPLSHRRDCTGITSKARTAVSAPRG